MVDSERDVSLKADREGATTTLLRMGRRPKNCALPFVERPEE